MQLKIYRTTLMYTPLTTEQILMENGANASKLMKEHENIFIVKSLFGFYSMYCLIYGNSEKILTKRVKDQK
jgi:hypothetical protein